MPVSSVEVGGGNTVLGNETFSGNVSKFEQTLTINTSSTAADRAILAQETGQTPAGDERPNRFARLMAKDPEAAVDEAVAAVKTFNDDPGPSTIDDVILPIYDRAWNGAPTGINSAGEKAWQDAIRTAYFRGDITKTELADLVENFTEYHLGEFDIPFLNQNTPNVALETVLGSGNPSMIKDVGLELYGRADVNDRQQGAAESEGRDKLQYALAFSAFGKLSEFGDTSVSERIFHDLWYDDGALETAAEGVLETGVPGGLDFLIGQTKLRAAAGIMEPDVADEVIQTILAKSQSGSLLLGSTTAAEQIAIYVVQNFDRIASESTYPYSGSDDATTAAREANDDVFLEDVVATLLFNPAVSDGTARAIATKFDERSEELAAIVTEDVASDDERIQAATEYAFLSTTLSEGIDYAVASQDDYSGVIDFFLDLGADALPEGRLPDNWVKTIADKLIPLARDKAKGQVKEQIEQLIDRNLIERQEMVAERVDTTHSATFPDPRDSNDDAVLAQKIYNALVTGRSAAENVREDKPAPN